MSIIDESRKFGSKIENFCGSRTTNPAKLAPIDWFSSTTKYQFMWMFEGSLKLHVYPSAFVFLGRFLPSIGFICAADDTFSSDYGRFMSSYERNSSFGSADLIADGSASLPFWFVSNWRIGDPQHGLRISGVQGLACFCAKQT